MIISTGEIAMVSTHIFPWERCGFLLGSHNICLVIYGIKFFQFWKSKVETFRLKDQAVNSNLQGFNSGGFQNLQNGLFTFLVLKCRIYYFSISIFPPGTEEKKIFSSLKSNRPTKTKRGLIHWIYKVQPSSPILLFKIKTLNWVGLVQDKIWRY